MWCSTYTIGCFNPIVYNLQTQDNLLHNHSTTTQIWNSTLIQYYHETHRLNSIFSNCLIIPFFICPRSNLESWISFSSLFILIQPETSQSQCLAWPRLVWNERASIWRISLSLVLLNVFSHTDSVYDFWGGTQLTDAVSFSESHHENRISSHPSLKLYFPSVGNVAKLSRYLLHWKVMVFAFATFKYLKEITVNLP